MILMISYFAPPESNAESILVGKFLRKAADNIPIKLITSHSDEMPDLRKTMDHPLSNWRKKLDVTSAPRWNPAESYEQLGSRSPFIHYQKADYFWKKDILEKVNLEHVSLIYSRSQPGVSHSVALACKKKIKVPWVAQFSDPWANNPYHRHTSNFVQQRLTKQESMVIHEVDYFIFPTIEMLHLYNEQYPDLGITDRSFVLPHCFDAELYPMEPATRNNKTIVSYIGDLYGLRSPDPLLHALLRMYETDTHLLSDIEFRFYGYIEEPFLQIINSFKKETGLNVQVFARLNDYMESLRVMKEADLLLLLDAEADTNVFLASKLIDYFGARKPIFGITPSKGTASSLLAEYGYQAADPRNINEICEKLTYSLTHLEQLAVQAEQADISRFTSDTYCSELLHIFSKAVEARK